MNASVPETPPPALGSRTAFADAIGWGLHSAADRGARQITLADPDFAEWPLGDAGVLQVLTGWLRRPGRRLVLLAAGYDQVPRRHPRFVSWRRDWSHAIEPRQPDADLAPEVPTLLLDDTGVLVHLMDALQWRGQATVDTRAALLWRERLDGLLQRSEPAFPVQTLGL